MPPDIYDCIVIGAGPSGLTASVFLARYRRRVLTFHHASPRNLYSHGVHGFLGHEGILPVELLMRGQEEVRQYGGTIVEARVRGAERLGDCHFRIEAMAPSGALVAHEARTLLLATGLKDLTPDCPGFSEFYGTTVFHCPDCDGYEVTGKRVAVLGRTGGVVGLCRGLRTWTDRLTVVTDGETDQVDPAQREALGQLGIDIIERPIAGLEGDVAQRQLARVRFADGSALECDALFFDFGTVPAADLHVELGCTLDGESGLVAVNGEQETSVSGVYAAGDLTPRSQLAVVAAAEGAMAAIAIHKALGRLTE